MAGARTLGSFIRRQRELQQLSLRQAAGLAGISNPYLSQIERGLREPSEAVIEALARTLEISADTLYAQAGRRRSHAKDGNTEPDAIKAIRADPDLSSRQRQALLEVYHSFTGHPR